MAVIELKTPGEIDAMHAAGVVVADTLAAPPASPHCPGTPGC